MAAATGERLASSRRYCPSASRASTSTGAGMGRLRSSSRGPSTKPATCSRRSTSFAPCAARARSITTTRSSRGRSRIPAKWAMCRFISAALLVAFSLPAIADRYPGVGRAATPAEIAAWDIDVRPDFKGLPPGSGSVAKGQEVWEAKCASCHGTFGESNEVFAPLVGGTTADDIRTGRAKALATGESPRPTLMKLSSISTLWDYIRRAMPWDKPKSITVDEVYADVAYLLSLGDIVPVDFVLSDRNIAEVQARL